MGVETHNNRYFYDTDTVNFVEMLGGYIDGNFFVPIRFGVKVSQTGRNSLYIVVSENKIEKSRVIKPRSQKESVPNGSRLPIVSISKVLENVNSKDILRYVPDGFLSGERLKAKYEAIAETIKYTNDKNDRKYREYIKKGDMKSAQRMVKAAAKAAGYNSPLLFHGTDSFGFTKFDLEKMDDGRSIFATSIKEVAATYSGASAVRDISDKKADISKLNDNILYLCENKKETKAWFQFLSAQMPLLEGKSSGFIRSISQVSPKSQGKEQKSRKTAGNPYTEYEKPITISDVRMLREIIKAHNGERVSVNDFTSDDIQAAQKWAYKFYGELQEKSPFFRAWFGDWRSQDNGSCSVVVSTGKEYSGAGNTYNNDTNKKISWGSTVVRETNKHAVKDKSAVVALGDISEIVKSAILFDTIISEPSSNSKMKNTAFMHSFYSVYEKNGSKYLLKLFVEEALPNNGGESFTRAYELKDIEKIAELPNGVLLESKGLTDDNSATTISISNLYSFVKTYDKEFHPGKDVNEALLNKDGTPRIFYHGSGEVFTTFDKNKLRRKGIYFTDNAEYASNYRKQKGKEYTKLTEY